VAYWFENERKLPTGRLAAAYYVITGLSLLLLSGFYKLQIMDTEKYALLAERNRIRTFPIVAPRGRILDREGRVLVDSYPGFGVLLLRDDLHEVERHLPEISAGLEIPLEELRAKLAAAAHLPKYESVKIKRDASEADIAFVESHRLDIPVLELHMDHRRNYRRNGFLAHTVGYVGEVSEQQVARSKGKYQPGDIIGKAGLERQYNDTLMGKDGYRRVVVNSVGREMGRLEHVEAIPGKEIQVTLDLDLQQVAEEALGQQKGAVVALDPRTGEVLAMASRPAPDPRDFARGIESEKWRELNESSDAPMLNRAIQAQLAPGSVFKIVMAAAYLDDKTIPGDFSVYCGGAADFYGRAFRCHVWRKGGHGQVALHKAVVQSCDIFFYNVGKRLGIERIAQYATAFGLGRRTGIDLPAEEAGLVPSQEWKQRVFRDKWYAGETISVAIGQGALISTPLQLARTVGGIALGGVFKQPHLLKGMKDVAEERFPLSEEHTEKVTRAMFGVVNEGGGTAAGSRLPGIELSGKTGTAQLISNEGLQRVKGSTRHLVDNAWFVGLAPRRNPEIVLAVLVEQGAHGSSAAAPIARDVVKRYYEKKAAREKLQLTAAGATPEGDAGAVLPASAVRRSPRVLARRDEPAPGGAQPR